MATIKEILTGNTSIVEEATELLKVLSDRAGQYVWKQLTAEGGDFVAFVTADDESAYPDGGTQDGYWYEQMKELVYLYSETAIEDGGTSTDPEGSLHFII